MFACLYTYQAASDLKEECERNNITVLSYGSFRDRNDADNQLKHIKVSKFELASH